MRDQVCLTCKIIGFIDINIAGISDMFMQCL